MSKHPDEPDFSFLGDFPVPREDAVTVRSTATPGVQDAQAMVRMRAAAAGVIASQWAAAVQAADNPFLEAARPLLRALAEIPAALPAGAGIEDVRESLAQAVTDFEQVCGQANLSWKHMVVLRYCLCTALDEAINRTAWGGGGPWAKRSLLIMFEGEADGGEKFFLLTGRMAVHPQEYAHVLAVLLRILCLGFEGRYSVIEDGPRHLEQIRKRLMTLLGTGRGEAALPLSPHAHIADTPRRFAVYMMPLVTGLLAVLLLVAGLFAWYRIHLCLHQEQIRVALTALETLPVQRPLRLSVLLRHEIAQGLVTVDEDDAHSVVVFRGDAMFASGQTRLTPSIVPVLDRVATEIAVVGGDVTVIGHTDNQQVRASKLGNNQLLSEERASRVAELIARRDVPMSHIRTEGRGDTQPVADNNLSQGRAKNRRVEIIVTRREV